MFKERGHRTVHFVRKSQVFFEKMPAQIFVALENSEYLSFSEGQMCR